MDQRNASLREQAKLYAEKLSKHPVLKDYWTQISLILKGSVARGKADKYSDIDFVFYCEENVRKEIVKSYHQKGLTNRTDGVFIFLENWAGHYHFESLEHLKNYFIEQNLPQIWECQNAVPLHDPSEQYKSIIEEYSKEILKEPLPAIKRMYLDLQLTFDWMVHPLKRGDKVAIFLHSSKVVQKICQISFLLDGLCYPHDKWIFTYFEDTRFGKSHKELILDFISCISDENIQKDLELESYPQFTKSLFLIQEVGAFIKKHYGEELWIDEWFLYV